MSIKRHEEPLMARTKQVRVTIAPDGTCTVDAINFIGPACQAATGEIMAALGGPIDRQLDKPEIHVRERRGQSEREQAR
jgi:hypothetical protein